MTPSVEELAAPLCGADELEGLTAGRPASTPSLRESAFLLALGIGFGTVLMKSEVASWYRIFEMFRFESFRLYGVIGSAIATAALGIALLRRLALRSQSGDPIVIPPKATTPWYARYLLGGIVFGFGWGLLGACPGPIFAWLGAGQSIYLVPLGAAMLGTCAYGAVRSRLPH